MSTAITLTSIIAGANNPGIPGVAPIAMGRFGWYCAGCVDLTLRSIGMVSHAGFGFGLAGFVSAGIPAENVLIDSCFASDNGWDGMAIFWLCLPDWCRFNN